MFITKTALPRRTFLRGMGVTLGLPLLDAMVPAASALANTAARPVRRLGFVYIPNGAVMTHWQPEGNGKLKELSPTLSPLAPFQDQVIVPIGLSQKQAEALGDGNGEHSRRRDGLPERRPPEGDRGRRRPQRHHRRSDRRAAHRRRHAAALARAGDGADLPDRQLRQRLFSCVYTNSISWRTATTPNPHETNPRIVFQRMFGDGGSREERLAQMQEDRSILDWVTADIAHLQKQLGPADRSSVNEYLDSVREVERRLQVAERQQSESVLELARSAGRGAGVVRRAREADVRPRGAGVPGRHHAGVRAHAPARSRPTAPIRSWASTPPTTRCRTTSTTR